MKAVKSWVYKNIPFFFNSQIIRFVIIGELFKYIKFATIFRQTNREFDSGQIYVALSPGAPSGQHLSFKQPLTNRELLSAANIFWSILNGLCRDGNSEFH
jgi:hypothetical protein